MDGPERPASSGDKQNQELTGVVETGQVLAICVMLIGVAILYVGWANVSDLIPPFTLGEPARPSVVYIGDNWALQYTIGGEGPPEGSHAIFAALTLSGILNIVSGYYFFADEGFEQRVRLLACADRESGQLGRGQSPLLIREHPEST